MDDISSFTDKGHEPTPQELAEKLGDSRQWWNEICAYVIDKYPKALPEWNFPGAKYGWSFRMRDKRRAIVYLLPREGFFKVAFVFGDKAVESILDSTVSTSIKERLQAARKYAEGRGIQLSIEEPNFLENIRLLVDMKLRF